MRHLFLILAMCASWGHAQQDARYSMYMFNGLVLNPAYAGVAEVPTLNLLARWQWVGVDGAPTTQSISFDTPIMDQRSNVGVWVVNESIGLSRTTNMYGNYAFRFELGPGKLALGAQGGVMLMGMRWEDRVTVDTESRLTELYSTAVVPNAGGGLFYHTERFYFGASAPHLINQAINPGRMPGVNPTQWNHYFITSGIAIPITEHIDFKPSFLLKSVRNAPWQFDLNAAILFNKTLWLGISYRNKESLVAMTQFEIANKFRIGYAYDYTTSSINKVTTGSHELMVGIDFGKKKKRVRTPRYF